jgi:DegV family protein with EDD domain
MYYLFVDSDCDITLRDTYHYGFKLISMPFIVGDEIIYPYKNEDEFEFKPYYNSLRGGNIPKTTSINASEYVQYFEPCLQEGKDILYVHFSSKLSGTFNNLNLAIEELKEKYPERRIVTVDTMSISLGALNILKDVGELYKANKSIDEIVKYVEDNRLKVAAYFYAPNLKFFAKSGRISNFAAFMGGVINLKVIININADGEMKSIGKCRGTIPTLNRLIDYMKEKEVDLSKRIVIAHSDDIETAQLFENLVKKNFGDNVKIEYAYVNPTAGCHCGPDNVGVSFFAKER